MATKSGMATLSDIKQGRTLYYVNGARTYADWTNSIRYIQPSVPRVVFIKSRPITYKQLCEIQGVDSSLSTFSKISRPDWVLIREFWDDLPPNDAHVSLQDRGIMPKGKRPHNRNRFFVTMNAAKKYAERLRLSPIKGGVEYDFYIG